MSDRKNILTTATLVMIGLAVVITATGAIVSYRNALSEKKSDLQALVLHEAKIIEATFRHNSYIHNVEDHDQPGSVTTCPICIASVDLVADILNDGGSPLSVEGKSIELVVGTRKEDAIHFLLQRKRAEQQGHHVTHHVPWESELAEPMRLALLGQSGIVQAQDFDGEIVLAAYAPIELLGWGVVATVNMAELQRPFISSVRNSLALSFLAIGVGLIILRRKLKPLLKRVQDREQQAQEDLISQKYAFDQHSIVVITNPSGKITYANDKFCEISQYAREELIGHSHRIINSGYHPRSFFTQMWHTITAGEVWQGEICNKAKDGSLYWVDTTIVPLKDKDECISQYVAVRTDISARKQNEETLIESLVATASAKSADRAKSEFLANMSHEIRTPMTAILGYADNLLDAGMNESDKLNCIHTIRQNGEHLLCIVNDILDLSKVEAGKMEVSRSACQPCHVIAEVASLMSVRAEERGLSFNLDFVGEIPETIQSDAIQLRKILNSVIGNAIKFTDTGSISLVTRLVNDNGAPFMQFDVIDTGCGMSDELTSKLFQPFMQADNSSTRRFGGTGLGLTLSKRFAEMLGGDVVVAATEVGMGTTFRITVETGKLDGVIMLDDPKSSTAVIVTPNPQLHVASVNLQGCRILLAEDNKTNQILIAGVLRKSGIEVTIVENGKLSLDAALAARDEGHPFDIVLTDMQMPVMDGYESTSLLRQKGYTGPIIALTAHAMSSDREKCIKAGCDDYATKPINRKQLIETIQRQLQRAENLVPVSV